MGIDLAAVLRRVAGAVRELDFAAAARAAREAFAGNGAEPAAEPRPPKVRQSLRGVVAELRERQAPAAEPPPYAPEMDSRTFTCAAGSRDYRLFVPAGELGGLLVMLHGCMQTPDDFALGTGMNAIAAEHGLVVVWPGQGDAHNPRSCWNWFDPANQQRGSGEPAIIAGLAQSLVDEFHLPRERVFVAGLSAGGSMAAVLGEAYPELFAAVGVHSGLACGTAHDAGSALAAMRGAPAAARPLSPVEGAPRVIVFQGTSDQVVHPMNADRLVARASALAGVRPSREAQASGGDRSVGRSAARDANGHPAVELWMIDGTGHGWSGGRKGGSFTEPAGPDASAEMLRFFLAA